LIRPGDTFSWWGRDLAYFDHPYNSTIRNERAVEVPIALVFLEGRTGEGLEVGNVLGHYVSRSHRVADLYEEAPGVENVDVFEVDGSFDWIVAISTLEHIRWDRKRDELDPGAAVDALYHLRSLVAPGGELLVTTPFGQHPRLDAEILAGTLEPDAEGTLVFEEDRWEPLEGRRVWRSTREHGWAGSVWVAKWQEGLS